MLNSCHLTFSVQSSQVCLFKCFFYPSLCVHITLTFLISLSGCLLNRAVYGFFLPPLCLCPLSLPFYLYSPSSVFSILCLRSCVPEFSSQSQQQQAVCVCVSKFPYRTTKGEWQYKRPGLRHFLPVSFTSFCSPLLQTAPFFLHLETHTHTHKESDVLHKQAHKIFFIHMHIPLNTPKSKQTQCRCIYRTLMKPKQQ